MDGGTGISGGNTIVYRLLSENDRFWVIKRVMNGIEEKGTTKILIYFSELILGDVRGGR